ncbi:hypothetical protein HG535_0B06420 [Zygotorulaspora mrakii]|uniref:Uncharacterized protein n=1 Tax=Zygotorulaspora mrakii TaxID=42260 RepID=A0A7H9AZH9_ZYGMR|nr:uncharacterized protein HG535_0B06420 [Zygotorulaspora mrakii]QLG71597.1 hypothetical protein HG535_0B06420 [Zygotorulaspora mrakii]
MNPDDILSGDEEEYDDLDDLLDEDPSKLLDSALETQDHNEPRQRSTVLENEDPEVQEMIDDLQREFSNMITDEGVDEKVKEEQSKNFQQILETLSKTSQSTTSGTDVSGEPHGFKNVVSKTLNRLKENGSKVDTNLAQEEKQRNTDDILSQLLSQLSGVPDGQTGADGNGENMDHAILDILNKMSSKEVLYQPMKEMHVELGKWLDIHAQDEEHLDRMETYRKQHTVVANIVSIYERDLYTNEAYREEITALLDELEQLGDSPINKGFANPGQADADAPGNDDIENFTKLLEISGDDENLGNLDKELQDTCKQQ